MEGCPLYEIHGGAFAQLYHSPLRPSSRPSHLNVLYLPSTSRGREKFTKVSYGDLRLGSVCELCIDPDQELMVLIGGPVITPV
jgi:hypothetical protein